MKFEKGTKVKLPKTKSYGDPINESSNIRKAITKNIGYLFITGVKEGFYICSLTMNDTED